MFRMQSIGPESYIAAECCDSQKRQESEHPSRMLRGGTRAKHPLKTRNYVPGH